MAEQVSAAVCAAPEVAGLQESAMPGSPDGGAIRRALAGTHPTDVKARRRPPSGKPVITGRGADPG